MNTQITKRSVNPIALTIIIIFIVISAFYLIINDAKADTVEENFEYSGVRELKVNASLFNLKVTGYTGDNVEGQIIMPQNYKNRNYVEVMHSKKGSILVILVEAKKGWIPPSSEDKIIYIRVPRDIKVDLKTSSGDIETEDIETYDIRLKSSSGDIDVNNCSGSLNIKSSSGDQSIKEYTGDIYADTSSGKQFYEEITGNIEAESSSGDITIDGQTGTLILKASSGDLKGRDVYLKGDSSFTTSSGSISFEFKNNFDELSFDLKSSSGKLNVGQSRVRGRLVIGGGKIKITGESSSGAQTYR
jgi:DUF4097 and DUF4098 domain-containing protein YvlB